MNKNSGIKKTTRSSLKNIAGWIGVGITLTISGIWAYWGAIENFHEGWYSESLWANIGMMLFQYLLFTFIFVILAVIALKWRKIGLFLHIAVAGFCIWFFSGASFSVLGLLIVMPIISLGLIYFLGEPKPKKWAYGLLVCVPLIIIISVSVPSGIKVSRRMNDNDFGPRLIEGNGVTLIWAPRGPGWPDRGVKWEEARQICSHLSEDGTTLTKKEQNIWRLPTVDEAVRSMMLHGQNAGGIWDAGEERAFYEKIPDKETPLWDVHSQVIYYWTSETYEKDDRKAFIVVYHGGIFSKMKIDGQSYLSFRAVKDTGTKNLFDATNCIAVSKGLLVASDEFYNFYLNNGKIYSIHWNGKEESNDTFLYNGYFYFESDKGIYRLKVDATEFELIVANGTGWNLGRSSMRITSVRNGAVCYLRTSITGIGEFRYRISNDKKWIEPAFFGQIDDLHKFFINDEGIICVWNIADEKVISIRPITEGLTGADSADNTYEGYRYFVYNSDMFRVRLDGTSFERVVKAEGYIRIEKVEDRTVYYDEIFDGGRIIEKRQIEIK